MGNPLLDRRTPREWYRGGPDYTVTVGLACMERLCDAVQDEVGEQYASDWRESQVSVAVRFEEAAYRVGTYLLRGSAEVEVPLICQRSLEPYTQPLRTELDVALIADGERDEALEGTELWELDDATFRLVDVLDEALVMAIPMSPRREPDDSGAAPSDEVELPPDDTTRPFADLRARMAQKETGD